MLDLYTMGERIRQAREDMGYTRETFSEMANITPRYKKRIRCGCVKTKNPEETGLKTDASSGT